MSKTANFSNNFFQRDRVIASPFIASMLGIFFIHGITEMLFGVMGTTQASKGWSYTIALFSFLCLGGSSLGVVFLTRSRKWQLFGCLVSAFFSGALLGFYYGGIFSQGDPQNAMISAIVTALTMCCLTWFLPQFFALTTTVWGGICAYAFALVAGVYSVSAIAVKVWFPGIIWGIACCSFLIVTLGTLFDASAKSLLGKKLGKK